MGNPAKKNNDSGHKSDLQAMEDRENWQKEFIARQEIMKTQMDHRMKMRKVPKAAWIFMGIWGSVFGLAIVLFLMSFNPATKEIVNTIIGAFRVF